MKMDKSFIRMQNETGIIIESFSAALKRIGKEQNKTNIELEDI